MSEHLVLSSHLALKYGIGSEEDIAVKNLEFIIYFLCLQCGNSLMAPKNVKTIHK